MSEKKSVTEQVLKNSIWVSILALVTKAGGLIFAVILARYLLPENFGAYTLSLSVAFIFMSFADLGINQALVIFFSKALTHSKNEAKSYFNFLFKIKFYASLVITFILLASAYFLANYVFDSAKMMPLLILAAVYTFFFSLTGFFVGFLYIYKRTNLDLLKEFLFQVFRLVLILAVFAILPSQYWLLSTFVILLITSIAMLLYSLYFTNKFAPFVFSKISIKINKRKILKFLFYLIIGGISVIIFSEVDVFMLGVLVKNLSFVGYYQSALMLVLGVIGVTSITPVLLPILSSFKESRMKPAFERVVRYTCMFSIPACLGIFILGKYFIKTIFGADYLSGAFALYFLSFLIISEPLTNLFSTLFSARKKPKYIATSLIIATIVNLALNYILISYLLQFSLVWAIAGAAISTLISRYLLMFSLAYYSKREFNISINLQDIIRPLFASLVMSLAVYLISIRIDMNLVSGVFLIIFGALLYLAVMFLIKGLRKEDIHTLLLLFKR